MTTTQQAKPAGRIFNIAAGVPFLDALALEVLARWGGDPLHLARVTVLLPTRRACRSLREAFLRASEGRPLVLPRMRPLGDLDDEEVAFAEEAAMAGGALTGEGLAGDLPPAMPGMTRQLRLAQEVRRAYGRERTGSDTSAEQAVLLAGELARLIDQVETEGLTFDGLDDLVEGDHAEHWIKTVDFLELITERWPAIEKSEGAIGPAERRRRLLEAQAEAWRAAPPQDPVIVAGSTGSIPATADLIGVVAGLPQGMVVLAGLDRASDTAAWQAIEADPSHPQHGLARLLARLSVPREAVADLADHGLRRAPGSRAEIMAHALAPAAVTDTWRDLAAAADGEKWSLALRGLSRVDCANPAEEALTIALMMRRQLEVPGATAALVTPDRSLARRVAVELRRWDVTVDDSAGVPLDQTAPGTFLRLLAQAAAERFAPVPLLALLKHPLAAGGMAPDTFRARVRRLELSVLRGVRPAPGLSGLRAAIKAAERSTDPRQVKPPPMAWFDRLSDILAPLAELPAGRDGGHDLAVVARAHAEVAEALAATDSEPGPLRVWAQDAGESAAAFFAELIAAADAASGWNVPLAGYPALVDALMLGRVVRPRYGRHPRAFVWGPLEARLQSADLVILGSLNEGTWPAETDPGPWLNRPMRRDFGLPPPERRIGLSAQDFAQMAGAETVVMTRSLRQGGAPTVPSRWLLRLDALLGAAGLKDQLAPDAEFPWRAWARQADDPGEPQPEGPPAPTPPVAARPRRLSVTQIETWMRDPYGVYARHVLGLQALDPLDADPGAADFGNIIHAALEYFVKEGGVRRDGQVLSAEAAVARLEQIGAEVFREFQSRPGIRAYWWPRFRRVAAFVVDHEVARASGVRTVLAERRGKVSLDGPAGPFTLSAKADRLEVRTDDSLAVIDYKTGAPPARRALLQGFSPQLPLEAAMVSNGAFEGLPEAMPSHLEFWQLSGRRVPGRIHSWKTKGRGEDEETSVEMLALQAWDGLGRLVARFDDPATPYHARPRAEWAPAFSDYEHLARVKEWAFGGGEDE